MNIYIYIYTCLYIHFYIHIHTHIHTYTHASPHAATKTCQKHRNPEPPNAKAQSSPTRLDLFGRPGVLDALLQCLGLCGTTYFSGLGVSCSQGLSRVLCFRGFSVGVLQQLCDVLGSRLLSGSGSRTFGAWNPSYFISRSIVICNPRP